MQRGQDQVAPVGELAMRERVWGWLRPRWFPWLEPEVFERLVRRAVVLVVVGIAIGWLMWFLDGSSLDLDTALAGAMTSSRVDRHIGMVDMIGALAAFSTVAVVGAITTLVWRARTRSWMVGQLLVVSVCGALAIVGTVKLLVPRERPEAAIFEAFSSAFPSGHAARAIALLGVGAWLLAHRARANAVLAIWTIAALAAAIISGSRIYLGMHWPSDIVVGLAIGAAWLTLVLNVADERGLLARDTA